MRNAIRCCLLASAILFSFGDSQAQRLTVHVTYVSEAYVYLDAGREQGLHVGDSLFAFKGEVALGRLSVTGTSRNRSVTSFLGVTFPVAVGDTLSIDRPGGFPLADSPERAAGDEGVPAAPGRPSLVDVGRAATPARRAAARSPRVTGKLRFDMQAMRTQTIWRSTVEERTERSFYSPTAALRLGASGLPGGWEAGLDLNVTRRFSSHDLVSPNSLTRIYRASLRHAGTRLPVEVEAGRFQPSGDPAGTYWDGVQTVWRRSAFSAGFAIGLEPDRYNGFIQTDVPKVAGYLSGTWKVAGAIFRSQAAGALSRPTNEWLDHSYVGFEQDIRVGGVRLSGDLQFDEDPEVGGWTATRIYLRGSVPFPGGFSLSGRFQERRPYAYWREMGVIGTRRTQQGITASLVRAQWSLQAGWTGTTAAAGVSSDAWSGSFTLARLPLLSASFTGSVSLWRRAGYDSRYVTTTMSRDVGKGKISASWQAYSYETGVSSPGSHTLGLQWVGPLSKSFAAAAGMRYQLSSQLRGAYANGSLTWSF